MTQDRPLEFTLYARSNCPLCEAMEEELRPLIGKYNITVKRQYIDNEPVLEEVYGSKVPVLTRENEILCEYFLDKELVVRTINSAHK